MNIFFSIAGIYIFIALGFAAKRHFAERIDEKTLVLVSVYLLQPMLVFWGLTVKPIDASVIKAPVVFTLFILGILVLVALPARHFFDDRKERSIATVASIIGNTGNLGIPLGIALFGEGSIIYTSIINLFNVFLVYTVGVYIYSKGSFSISESLKNIFRLPAIWFAFGAIAFNLLGLELPGGLEMPLSMGAYSTMVVQLMIFGIYLATVDKNDIPWRLLTFVTFVKFAFIPLAALMILSFLDLENIVYNVVLLELLVPMAVMNVNLAALYDCRPERVAFLTFATSAIFLIYLFAMAKWVFV